MFCGRCLLYITAFSAGVVLSAPQRDFKIGMKALVLSTDSDLSKLPATAFDSHGIQYDLISFVTEQLLYDESDTLIGINRCVHLYGTHIGYHGSPILHAACRVT